MEELEVDISEYFIRHNFTPSEESHIARNDFEKVLLRHKIPPLFRPTDSNHPELQFESIQCLKYIARKHGLPPLLSQHLLSGLKSLISSKTQFQIAQMLKYSSVKDPNYIPFDSVFSCLAHISLPGNNHNALTIEIISQFVECLGIKIDSCKNDTNYKIRSKLEPYLQFMDGTMKTDILKKVEYWESVSNISPSQTEDTNGTDEEFETAFGGKVIPPKETLAQFGDSILHKSTTKQGIGNRVQADAVKTQQVISSNYKHNVSENAEIQSINLSKALNSGRSKSTQRGTNSTINPGRKGGSGSDRSWYRSTGWEISNFSEMANGKLPIKEDDVDWLLGKTDFGFNLTNTTVTIYKLKRISDIFLKLSEYQELKESTLRQLCHNFFSEDLNWEYANCRMTLLRAFENYSKAHGGKVPVKVGEILLQFKTKDVCTTDMKRLIWKILVEDDTNLYSTFEDALNQLKLEEEKGEGPQWSDTYKADILGTVGEIGLGVATGGISLVAKPFFGYLFGGTTTPIPTTTSLLQNIVGATAKATKNNDKELEQKKQLTECMEYIGRQVVFEERAMDLENRFGFSKLLLSVVKDTNFPPEVRVQAAEIVEDLLAYEDQEGLSKEEQEEYLMLYVNSHRNVDEEMWQGDEGTRFQTTLIRSILRTFDKLKDMTEVPVSAVPSEDTLELLVRLCTLSNTAELVIDKKLEALIVITLGNLANEPTSLKIPNSESLAYKLLKSDTMDEHGNINIEEETQDSEGEPEVEMEIHSDGTTISSIVANILVKSTKNFKTELSEESLKLLLQTVQKGTDKPTMILSSECLFHSSLRQQLPLEFINELRYMTTDKVTDIQIYLSATYCQTLDKLCFSNQIEISQDDINLFPQLYVMDQLAILQDTNYAEYINTPIIHILKVAAGCLKFSNEIFQLLTFIIRENVEVELVLEIITVNTQMKEVSIPQYCFEEIENVFVKEEMLFEASSELLMAAVGSYGAVLSPRVLEQAHQIFVFERNFTTRRITCFRMLIKALHNQDLAQYMFEDVDMELMSLRILRFLKILKPQCGYELDDTSDCDEYEDVQDDMSDDEDSEDVQDEASEPDNILGLKETPQVAQLCLNASLGLKRVIEYQIQGRKLSILTFKLYKLLLRNGLSIEPIIQSLIYAAENGQSLSSEIMSLIFSHFQENGEANKSILSLASVLVQNNQSMPDQFLNCLMDTFCTQTAKGRDIGEDQEYDMVLMILAKLAQNRSVTIPRARNVTKHFCNLWTNSSKNSRKRMGVLNSMTNFKLKESREDRARDLLKRFCLFWKKNRSYKHRLEILNGLVGLVSSAKDDVNKVQVHQVFANALKDRNAQIIAKGLDGFILLNWDKAPYCSEEDFDALTRILGKAGVGSEVQERVKKFLVHNLDIIPEEIREEIEIFQKIESGNDLQFLKVLKAVLPLRGRETADDGSEDMNDDDEEKGDLENSDEEDEDSEESDDQDGKDSEFNFHTKERYMKLMTSLTESPKVIHRLESILLEKTHSSLKLVNKAFTILKEFNFQLPSEIYEALTYAMSTHQDSEELILSGEKIFNNLINDQRLSAVLTEQMIEFLLMTKDKLEASLLLRILSTYEVASGGLSSEIRDTRSKLKFQIFLLKSKKDENSFDQEYFGQLLNDLSCYSKTILAPDLLILLSEVIDQSSSESEIIANPKLCLLLATSILEYDEEQLPESVLDLTSRSIEELIINNTALTMPILKAYEQLIGDGHATNLHKCLDSLTKVFSSERDEEKSGILGCLLAAITDPPTDLPFLPFASVQLITAQIKSPNPKLRQQSFEALTQLKKDYVIFDPEANTKITLPNLRTIGLQIYEQIYKSPELAASKIDSDLDFAFGLVNLLLSLEFWDFQCLRDIKKSKWRQCLITSDFLQTFALSENMKVEMTLGLSKLYQSYVEEDAEELIFMVKDRVQSFGDRDNREKVVRKILSTLSQDLVEYEEVEKLLEKNQTLNEFITELERMVLLTKIKSKIQFSIRDETIELTISKLVSICGMGFMKMLVSKIEKIEDFSELQTMIRKLIEVKETNPDFFLEVKMLEWGSSTSDIILHLQAQVLLTLLPSQNSLLTKSRLDRFAMMLVGLLSQGISLSQIKTLLHLGLLRVNENMRKYLQLMEHLLSQSYLYQINPPVFDKIVSALKNSDLVWDTTDIVNTCNKIITECIFDSSKSGVKNVEIVAQELVSNNQEQFQDTKDMQADIVALLISVRECKKQSKIHCNEILICNWKEEDIKNWTSLAKNMNDSEVLREEAFMVIKHAFYLTTNFHLTHVQLLSCLLTISHHRDEKGLLCQVATGSGKSAIIGVLSVFFCLLGLKVDVYTSSSVLAERDAKEWSKFYALFGLTCADNVDLGHSYISGEKKCYTKDIVYGDCSQFQFDYLRDAYSDLGTRAGRDFDKSVAIVDEVDATFVDDASKLARLSSTLPGMDLLHLIYFLIMDRLNFIKGHLFQLFGNIYYLEGQVYPQRTPVLYVFADVETNDQKDIKDLVAHIVSGGDLKEARIYLVNELESFVEDHLKEYATALITQEEIEGYPTTGKISLPSNLRSYAESQIPKWVNSALTSIAFQENIHYVVHEGKIKPVDFSTTGIVHDSTNWNNGLHQFLQIKHGVRVDSESVTTNFLSNLAIINKYNGKVTGFTGTLGSQAGRKCLEDVYNVQLLIMPETHYKRYLSFPPYIAPNEVQWLEEIARSTLQETRKKRGVLIICETIEKAELVGKVLTQLKSVKVKMYTKNQQNQERNIERIHPGDVIVATNLAGRGTDIKTADVEMYGGLHVCLTFLPMSLRVEEQAFGRTSRQGKKGTGQLITLVQGDVSLTDRDRMEEAALKEFEEKQLPKISMKDELFSKFLRIFQTIREKVREEKVSLYERVKRAACGTVGVRPTPTQYEVTLLQAVEERWAVFLKRVDDGSISVEEAEEEYSQFEKELEEALDADLDDLISEGNNLYYFVQLGNYEFNLDSKFNHTLEKAIKYYEKAVDLDPQFATGAYVGLASALLKGDVNLVQKDCHQEGYKEEALMSLRTAQKLLCEEMALITVTQSLIQRQGYDRINGTLFQQMTEKSNLLGSYMKSVEGTISTVEKSLRRIHCSSYEKGKEEVRMIPDNMVRDLDKIPWTTIQAAEYHLHFHDLTVREDSGIVFDQIVNTISGGKLAHTFDRAKEAVRKLLKNDNEEKDKPIVLHCPAPDFKAFLDSKELIKFSSRWKLEINGLDIVIDDTTKVPKLNFDWGKIPSGVGHYSIKFLEISGVRVQEIWGSEELAKFPLKIHHIPSTDEDNEDEEEMNLIETIYLRPKKYRTYPDIFEQNVSLTVEALVSSEEVNKIIQFVSENQKKASKANISLYLVDSKALQEHVTFLQEISPNCTLSFENLTRTEACEIVPYLRKLKSEISFVCRNMSQDSTTSLLANADISQEDILLQEVKDLIGLYMADCLPLAELRDLQARGITLIVTFNERKFVPWIAVAGVVALAALQATAGTALICTGFGATVGMGLITEGMADLVTAQRIYSTREFSWADYGTQKAVSLTISAVSMGLSSLKDGAKGAAMLYQGAQGAVKQTVVDAGNRVMIKGVLLNTTIEVTGKNLKSLAVKQLAVSTLETGARIGLKSLANSLTDFCFDQVKDGIVKEVSMGVNVRFHEAEFKELMAYHWTIDERSLHQRIQRIVEATMNPKAASGWMQAWDSVGTPLMNGILSSPQFLGSSYTRLTMIYGMLSGMREIVVVVDRLCGEVKEKLKEQKQSSVSILQNFCKLPKDTAEKLAGVLRFKNGFELEEDSLEEVEQRKLILGIFKRLEKSRKSFKMEENMEISKIKKSLVDTVANHIIRIANSHLVSPVMSVAVGSLVSKLSEELQDRFLVSEDQNTPEQNDMQKKVDDLKGKPERTPEEEKFLRDNDVKNTFRSQINYNAKDYTVAWQKREIVAESRNIRTPIKEDTPFQTKAPANLEKTVDGVLKEEPGDMGILFSMAAANKEDIKVVDDPNYKPTPEDLQKGLSIILYQKGTEETKNIGHFSILHSPKPLAKVENDRPMDCAYNVMAQLTGKSPDEHRAQAAQIILQNPAQFTAIQGVSNWIRERYPRDANEMLMLGGFQQHQNEQILAELSEMMQKRLKDKDVQQRIEAELTDSEKEGNGAGVVYILKVVNADGKEMYKVGLTGDDFAHWRAGQLRAANGEVYDIVAEIPVAYRYSTETIAHKILDPYRSKRDGVAGGTEYFASPPGGFEGNQSFVDYVKEAVGAAKESIEEIQPGGRRPATIDETFDMHHGSSEDSDDFQARFTPASLGRNKSNHYQ